MYAFVTQLLLLIVALAVGGYLLGRYVIIKTAVAGGIMGIIGAIGGIVYFIVEMIRIDHDKE